MQSWMNTHTNEGTRLQNIRSVIIKRYARMHAHTHIILFFFSTWRQQSATNAWYISIQVYIFTVERFAYLLLQMIVNLHINKSCMIFTFTFMHLADAFIQSDLQLHSG